MKNYYLTVVVAKRSFRYLYKHKQRKSTSPALHLQQPGAQRQAVLITTLQRTTKENALPSALVKMQWLWVNTCASAPSTCQSDRRSQQSGALLTVTIIGAGPAGVEIA